MRDFCFISLHMALTFFAITASELLNGRIEISRCFIFRIDDDGVYQQSSPARQRYFSIAR